jgi:hypothetical protein
MFMVTFFHPGVEWRPLALGSIACTSLALTKPRFKPKTIGIMDDPFILFSLRCQEKSMASKEITLNFPGFSSKFNASRDGSIRTTKLPVKFPQ